MLFNLFLLDFTNKPELLQLHSLGNPRPWQMVAKGTIDGPRR